jgi:hypothetical protein
MRGSAYQISTDDTYITIWKRLKVRFCVPRVNLVVCYEEWLKFTSCWVLRSFSSKSPLRSGTLSCDVPWIIVRASDRFARIEMPLQQWHKDHSPRRQSRDFIFFCGPIQFILLFLSFYIHAPVYTKTTISWYETVGSHMDRSRRFGRTTFLHLQIRTLACSG